VSALCNRHAHTLMRTRMPVMRKVCNKLQKKKDCRDPCLCDMILRSYLRTPVMTWYMKWQILF